MGSVFDYDHYMPHGFSLLWEPWLVLLWVGSDLMIVAVCMAIPIAIAMGLRRHPQFEHRSAITLFAIFILLCGVTHFMDLVTVWHPIYPLAGMVKMMSGFAALLAAGVLMRQILSMGSAPPPVEAEEVIARLEMALADVSRMRSDLEQRLARRTVELEETRARLDFAKRDSVLRSRNLIQLVSSLTLPGTEVHEYPISFLRDLRGRINALVNATSTLMEQGDRTRARLDRVIRRQVEPLFAAPETQFSTHGPDITVGAQGAQQISLVAWELASRFAQMGRGRQARGRIKVSWDVEPGPNGADQLVLEWEESFAPRTEDGEAVLHMGDGTMTPSPVPDFSETVLTRIVPRLLAGKGRVEIAGSIFRYRLTCPLDALDHSQVAPCEPDVTEIDEPNTRLLKLAAQ